MTKSQREARRAEQAERIARLTAAREEAKRFVATGVCPICKSKLRRNLALAGWYQCEQYGAEGFRARPSEPSCSFQCFTV